MKKINGKTAAKIFLIFLLSMTPLAFLLYWIVRLAVDMPFWDQWAVAPFVEKSFEGTLTFSHLFELHNESRILFPRVVFLGLAHLTGWNINYELCAIIFMTLLSLSVLAEQSWRTPDSGGLWQAIPFSALLFSTLQYECWTFGFTLIGHINVFFVVAGLSLLTLKPLSPVRFAGALLAGVVATYSYVNSIFYWISGLAILILALREQNSRKISLYLVWSVFAAVVLLLYFRGYQKPGFAVPFTQSLSNPLAFIGFLFAFLGGVMVNIPTIHEIVPIGVGAIGFFVFIGSVLICLYLRKPIGFWLALSSYALLSALAAAAGRSGYGIQMALSSRYAIFACLFWIALFPVSAIVIRHYDNYFTTSVGRDSVNPQNKIFFLSSPFRFLISKKSFLFIKTCLLLFAGLCVVFFVLSSRRALKDWREHHIVLASIQNELLSCDPDGAILAKSFPGPIPRKWLDFMIINKLSGFREKKEFSEYRLLDGQSGYIESARADMLGDKVFPGGVFTITTRINDLKQLRDIKAILIVNDDGKVIARSEAASGDSISGSSRIVTLQAGKLPLGSSTVHCYALLKDNIYIASLGEMTLEKIPYSDMKSIFQLKFDEHPADIAGYIDRIYLEGDYVISRGWARDPVLNKTGQWVILTDQNTNILAHCKTQKERPEVAKNLREKRLLYSGWNCIFQKHVPDPDIRALRAYVLLPEENKALRLNSGSLFE